jgi:glyoxylase-like metal-dependent hydrolase (beta-lactamase superfamily II)
MTLFTPMISRRVLLAGAAALPLANALPSPTRAAAPMMGANNARFNRKALGEFEVTTILSSTRPFKDPHNIFGLNASQEEFDAASAAARIPADRVQFFFTPTVVNTGGELILFDTGWKATDTITALAEAGYTPDQVDVVVLTHMHPDHIGGLMADGAPAYPNARYVTGAKEFDEWDMSGNEMFETQMRPLADQTTFINGGDAVSSGITGMDAFGHTPGHMVYMLESGGKQLLLGADFANHYVWSLAYPDWQVRFDKDKEMAVKTRRRILDMLATDGVPMIGYHMPWPGIGYVETREAGFRYVPHSYQMML